MKKPLNCPENMQVAKQASVIVVNEKRSPTRGQSKTTNIGTGTVKLKCIKM